METIEKPQMQERVPIFIEITEQDIQTAGPYTDCRGCIIWTALTRMGYKGHAVSDNFVLFSDRNNIYWGYTDGKAGITGEQLCMKHYSRRPFYNPEVVGKQIVLYPGE